MKKVIMLSSVLLGVILLTGCGKKQQLQSQPTIPEPTAQQPQSQSTQSQPSQPQNNASTPKQEDVIYRNDAIGFELKYPDSSWEISEKYDGYNDNENATTIQHLVGPKNFVDMSITVEKRFNTAENELASFLNPSQKGGVDFSKQTPKNITINGHKGFKVISGYEGTPAETIYLEIDKKSSFIISTSFSAGSSADPQIDPYVCEESDCMNVLNGILSTFEFTK
jgi:hypothetical protein